MTRPRTNHPNTSAPKAKSESPNIRIQRRRVSRGVCRNSADRAYHVPNSTDAQACISPTGSILNSTMAARPRLIDQNAMASGRSFHCRPGRRARRQNSIRPRPSIPYTPKRRGVSMHRRGVKTLHVVKSDRRVDQEAEQAGSDEIPECHRDEEVDRPLVGADPGTLGVPRDSRCSPRLQSRSGPAARLPGR